MHGSWHAPFFSTRAKPSYTNGYHHKEGGTVGGTVTVPKTEPLFHRNEGSVSLKRRFCLDRAESSFFSPSLSTPTIYYRLFPSKYYTAVHIRQQRPTLFCRREISPYIYTAFNNECKTINHFNS